MSKVYTDLQVDGEFIYNKNPQTGYVLTTDSIYRLYRTRNCITWDYMNYATAINIISLTMSSENVV